MARGTHSSNRSGRARQQSSPYGGRRTERRGRRRLFPRLGNDPGDRQIAAGVVLFALGLIAIALTFVPFITWQRSNTDLAVNLGTFATVAGLVLGFIGAYRQARSTSR